MTSKGLLPTDKLEFRKPQVDQFIRANDAQLKTIGLIGLITITTATIKLIKSYIDNKHEETLYEHEEKMLEIEIEKIKIEKEEHN